MKALEGDFKLFYDLTSTAFDAKGSIDDWTTTSFFKYKDEALSIEKQVQEWLQKCHILNKKLTEDYPDSANVALELRAEIDEFNQSVPLFRNLLNEAIREEDWLEICTIVGQKDIEFKSEELKL